MLTRLTGRERDVNATDTIGEEQKNDSNKTRHPKNNEAHY